VIRLRLGRVAAAAARRLGLLRVPRSFYARPTYYKGNRMSVIGPEDEVRWPTYSKMLDYEGELALVIGAPVRDAAGEGCIFGYTIFDDLSARDVLIEELLSRSSAGPAKGKDFDTGNALGPVVVTADEIADPHALEIRVRVNAEARGRGHTSEMAHSIPEMIAYASRSETLHPGEVLATGAAAGCTGLEVGRTLEPGDVVEVEIEGIGVLRNRIRRDREAGGETP